MVMYFATLEKMLEVDLSVDGSMLDCIGTFAVKKSETRLQNLTMKTGFDSRHTISSAEYQRFDSERVQVSPILMMVRWRRIRFWGIFVFPPMVANQKGTADKPQEQTNYGNTIREKIQEEGRLYNPHDHQEWQDGSKQNHYEANQDNYLSTQRFHLYNQHNTVWLGSGLYSAGSCTSHKPWIILEQRGWKRHPDGGLTRLGGSPGGTSL